MSTVPAVGKRVRGSLYVHASAVAGLSAEERALVERASRLAENFNWSIARLDRGSVVGLLDYPNFDREAFPTLARAALVDVGGRSVRYTNYDRSSNPLILHRKELLVSADHPERSAWAALTTELEQLGLFRDLDRIGRYKRWRAMLADAGRDMQGQRVR